MKALAVVTGADGEPTTNRVDDVTVVVHAGTSCAAFDYPGVLRVGDTVSLFATDINGFYFKLIVHVHVVNDWVERLPPGGDQLFARSLGVRE